MSDALITVEGATKDYAVRADGARATLRALRGIDLTVHRGEVLAIVGESGCGKTTLSRLILGIEPPSSGTVRIEGRPTTDYDRLARAALIQPIFQDPYSSLNPRLTIGQIIAAPLVVRGRGSRAERQEKVAAIMQQVGLPPHLRNAYPGQLSGGQRQRVAIARALIGEPEILVCDEPTSALDVSVQSQILNLIAELRERFKLTIVLISHNLAVVHHLADRVAVMYLGQIVESAPTEVLFATPRHHYTRALLDAILVPEPKRRLPRLAIDAEFPSPLTPPPGCAFHPRCPAMDDICRTADPPSSDAGRSQFRCHHPLVTAEPAPA
ncbi:MAG: ABC transporter ATP-binding protein [Variibacter sp.]